MSKRAAYPQAARHILVRDDDWDYLSQQFDRTSGIKPIGVSVAVRIILHAYVERLKAQAESARDLPED